MAAVALFMVGRLAKFNDIFTSTVPPINNFSNHALRINCLTLFVQLKIQNNILFLYTTDIQDATAAQKGLATATQITKLDGIATGAEVNPAVVSQADAEAGTATDERIWTALRVAQAITAQGTELTAAQGRKLRSAYHLTLTGAI